MYRSSPIPTETQIVEIFHGVSEAIGRYDRGDCIAFAIDQLTPDDAGDDVREEVSAAVRRAWLSRMEVMGA